MRLGTRTALASVVVVTLAAAGPMAMAYADGGGSGSGHSRDTKVFTLETSATAGNPEGVAVDKRTDAFFTGGTGDGTIFRGTLGDPTVHVFIPGASGGSAVGMKVFRGKLYVAGGTTGLIKVYDLASKALVGSFATGAGGFLNDLVVTEHGDVWVTDSFRPMLWHLTAAQVAAGTGTPAAVDVSSAITFTAGAFNLNGIVALRGGQRLVVVQTNTGALWRIDVNHSPAQIEQVDAPALVGGDGMIRDKGRLVVVIGTPAVATDPSNLTFVKLRHHDSRGRIDKVVTDPTLRGPSTVARDENRYLVVNADFPTPTKPSTTPFTISGLDRRHGFGGGH